VLRGEEGDDTLAGNDGNDSLISAAGNDTLDGGSGDDSLQSGSGDDSLTGGTGNDTLTAKDGKDAIAGGEGNDRLEGGKGADDLDGGEGNDVLLTAEGEFKGTLERRIRCGPGDDALTAGPADRFPSDCERIDGASLRLQQGGVIPLQLVCAAACKGTVRIRDAKNKINASAPVKLGAGELARVKLTLTAAETERLFKQKKVRLTARFELKSGGARQQVRATFTLLRRI
jgi:Ca2+-binding RTX toxin-like protein